MQNNSTITRKQCRKQILRQLLWLKRDICALQNVQYLSKCIVTSVELTECVDEIDTESNILKSLHLNQRKAQAHQASLLN